MHACMHELALYAHYSTTRTIRTHACVRNQELLKYFYTVFHCIHTSLLSL